MKTCATCKYMAGARDGGLDDVYNLTETAHRTCVRIIHGNDSNYEGEFGLVQEAPAAVLDGSGYAARLVVLPTFGCILHEDKE